MSESTLEDRRGLVVQTVIEGEKNRGSNGVVLLARTPTLSATYALVTELPSAELREVVEDLLSEDGNQFVYVLEGERTVEEERNVHIWKMSRIEVVAESV
jgi:hypothetical protein